MAPREKIKERTSPRTGGTIAELEEGLQIDKHSLDDVLIHHPDLVYRVGNQLTMLVSRRDAKKQELAEEEAKADGDIRRMAAKENEKLTEAEIKNLIRLDKDVKRVQNELLDLNQQVGEFSALQEGYKSRGYVLKDLVALYIADYYKNNTDSIGAGQFKEHRAQRIREKLTAERRENERD